VRCLLYQESKNHGGFETTPSIISILTRYFAWGNAEPREEGRCAGDHADETKRSDVIGRIHVALVSTQEFLASEIVKR
jgi:hypothetical protein